MGLTIDLHKHLIDVPAPLTKTSHPADPLTLDIRCKHWTEPVPPVPDRLMANVDPALREQIFDIPQAQRKPNIHHHHKPNDFWR